jgi:GT2 family glycosyltransferase
MSGIQETILNTKIHLGKDPIFIVSENFNERSYLALLISNHLLPLETKYVERALNPADNYFNTPYLNHIINQEGKTKSSKELKQIIDLHVEEGFDTKKLYGISINFETFVKLTEDVFDIKVPILFIFSEFKSNLESHESLHYNKILNYVENRSNVFFINAKELYRSPNELISTLSEWLSAKPFQQEKIKSLPFNLLDVKPHDDEYVRKCLALAKKSSANCKEVNLALLLIVDDNISSEVLLKYLNVVATQRQYPSKIYILQTENDNLNLELPSIVHSIFEITILKTKQTLVDELNELIPSLNVEYILLDNLYLEPVQELFDSLNDTHSLLSYSKLGIESNYKLISLSDLLAGEMVEYNLLFTKEVFLILNGFDTKLNDYTFLWDFAIRVLEHTHEKALSYTSSLTIPMELSPQKGSSDLNSYLFQKHKSIVENSLQDVLNLIAQNELKSIQELKALHGKANSLSLVLSHTKDELNSMQLLNSQLHQRIQYLENNWYQKFVIKVRRLKKIFFKKKSPGSGTLKRIWQAFRFLLSKSGIGIFRKISANVAKQMFLWLEKKPVEIIYPLERKQEGIHDYQSWINHKLSKETLDNEFNSNYPSTQERPLISIIMPVYNTPLVFLKEAIESVQQQQYPHWELCIADDNSTHEKVKKLLRAYALKDKRIKVVFRTENGHISATSNSAMELAKGEYVLFMDHDDLLTSNCIWEVVKSIHANTRPDIVYSDEDKIDEFKRHTQPYFKPDWSPDHLLAKNYIGHVCVIKKDLIDQVNGFRTGFEGSQDYDLLLRTTEIAKKIVHIPKVLYHWRIHQASAAAGEDVKPYAYIAAKKSLEETLKRRGMDGKVRYLSGLRGYRIDYSIQREGLVSIIIPTKDQTELLKNAIDSILHQTEYRNFEIIVLNNNSTTTELEDFLNDYTQKYPNLINRIEAHFSFNFSKLMNIGVSHARGEYILFLNNDVEVIDASWLSTMVSFAQQKHIGAVGARLLYPDDTIQHAGVIVGLGGVAGHAFTGQYKDDPGYFNLIQTVNNYSAVTAACLMCRKEVFEQVHGMDEQFEVEYNDVDFCLKIVDAGYYNVYVPQVELYHYESATRGHPHQSKASYERHLKEMKLFIQKWEQYVKNDPFYNPNLNRGVHDFGIDLGA